MIRFSNLLNDKNKKELQSLLMVLNGVVRELEYTLESNMEDKDKFSKSLILLKEVEDYSDKTRKLLFKIKENYLSNKESKSQ